jgi:hypothetical protein
MSLTTGRHLNRNHWTALPMPHDVIYRVHTLARRSNASTTPQFTLLDGTQFADTVEHDETGDNHDEDYADSDNGLSDDEDDNSEHDDASANDEENDTDIAGVMEEENNTKDDAATEMDGDDATGMTDEIVETAGADDEEEATEMTDAIVETAGVADEEKNEKVEENDEEENDEEDFVANKAPKHGHNLRPKAPRDYRHVHKTVKNIVMTQHSVKKGLKLYGEAGAEAVVSKIDAATKSITLNDQLESPKCQFQKLIFC